MFTKNTYLIPQAPSSLHAANGVELFLHHHHPDLFTGHFLTTNAPLGEASTLLNQENGGLNGDPSPVANMVQRKPTRKKDRHSKIYTAQGPRDRRVRLSIGIARKFFDLQETLGFDKPSKTLDWLLTKSKAAIKELVQSKHKGCGSGKSSSECELLSSAGNDETSENMKNGGKDSGGKETVSNLAKESRAKARARARERAREKMCIKQLSSGLNTSIPAQSRSNQLEFFQLSAGTNGDNIVSLNNEDLIQESIVIKRKMKNPSFSGQNVSASRDLSSNYVTPSGNATENWDVCSFTSQSNLYAILNQHKFINSNSTI